MGRATAKPAKKAAQPQAKKPPVQPKPPAPKTATVEAVAQACNLTVRRVNQLAAEGIFPKEGRGAYNLGKCMMAYIRYLQDAMQSRSTTDDKGDLRSLQAERTMLVKSQREREEFDLAVKRGEFVPAADVEATWLHAAAVVKTKVMGMSAKAAQVLPHLSSEDLEALESMAREALEELACQPSDE